MFNNFLAEAETTPDDSWIFLVLLGVLAIAFIIYFIIAGKKARTKMKNDDVISKWESDSPTDVSYLKIFNMGYIICFFVIFIPFVVLMWVLAPWGGAPSEEAILSLLSKYQTDKRTIELMIILTVFLACLTHTLGIIGKSEAAFRCSDWMRNHTTEIKFYSNEDIPNYVQQIETFHFYYNPDKKNSFKLALAIMACLHYGGFVFLGLMAYDIAMEWMEKALTGALGTFPWLFLVMGVICFAMAIIIDLIQWRKMASRVEKQVQSLV